MVKARPPGWPWGVVRESYRRSPYQEVPRSLRVEVFLMKLFQQFVCVPLSCGQTDVLTQPLSAPAQEKYLF